MAKMKGGTNFRAVLTKTAAALARPGTVRIGFLEGSTAPNGDSLPLRAALNEFGHENADGTYVPPRPFFRNMISAKSPEWPDGIAYQLKATKYDVKRTLNRVGEAIKGQLQESILDLWAPALHPKTIAKKGFDKPLIAHGDMINAAGYEVQMDTVTKSAATTNAAGFAKSASTSTKPT